jgi:NDP-sugar pyrophosphorylase family protein
MSDCAPELQDTLAAPIRAPGKTVEVPTLQNVPVVILAGGRGTRLAPYTSVLPKPLMPVGDQSILEIVVEQLAACGAKNVNICVGYLAHLIRAVFDHRAPPEIGITYVHEESALGTAAPLRLVEGLTDTFLVMNGDVLTTLDYRHLVRHHREKGNILTIAVHRRFITIDYGMLHLDDGERVQALQEKPEIVSHVSMGIYVMEPEVLEYIPDGMPFDVPELVQALLAREQPVGGYHYDGMWFDIGRADDHEQAVAAWVESRASAAVNGNGSRAPFGPPAHPTS